MKIRESGMPECQMWEKFFDSQKILSMLGIDKQTADVAEFGCGYGTFTIPAAKIINGRIYALDIEPDMARMTNEEAKKQRPDNIPTAFPAFFHNRENWSLRSLSIDPRYYN